MTHVQMGSLDVPGGSLFYEMAGEGPVVTLIHPGLWDLRTWDPQVPVLLDAGFRVLRYDVRGYGRSSRLTGESHSHVRDLAALLDALGVTQTLLVGCSMGGAIAIDLTLEQPDRVQALVVAASGLEGFEPLE
ncbi:MAG: alpha/beta fold hydrolase, partial [Actinomycetota bacterium]